MQMTIEKVEKTYNSKYPKKYVVDRFFADLCEEYETDIHIIYRRETKDSYEAQVRFNNNRYHVTVWNTGDEWYCVAEPK